MKKTISSVCILWFVPQGDEHKERALLIGVYLNKIECNLAIERLKDQPGFRDFLEGFEVSEHVVGEELWREGFISIKEALDHVQYSDEMNHHSKTWPLQEAKAKFSELVRLAQSDGPQTVTVHGQPAVVISKAPVLPKDVSKLTGADFIEAMRKGPLFDFEIPPRPIHGASRVFSFNDNEQK
jgi:antitoxin Phd